MLHITLIFNYIFIQDAFILLYFDNFGIFLLRNEILLRIVR